MATQTQRAFLEIIGFLIMYISSNSIVYAYAIDEQESIGFSLKLIPRFSTLSPVYQANLTGDEFLRQLSNLSDQRVAWLSSTLTTNGYNTKLLRPIVQVALSWIYVVQVHIGTPPTVHYLMLDTGTELSWIQCEGCQTEKCFELKDGYSFKYSESTTFQMLDFVDPRCDTKIFAADSKCGYQEEYVDGDKTSGILSTDTFAFDSNRMKLESTKDVVFGCGWDNLVSWGKNTGPENIIAGILAMGRGPKSIVTQLGNKANGRLSYCVQEWKPNEPIYTTLRFGNDAKFPKRKRGIQTASLLDVQNSPGYFVDIEDIGISGQRFGLAPDTFAIKRDGSGGLVLDMGTAVTTVYPMVYLRLKMEILKFFKDKLKPVDKSDKGFDLCYTLPAGYGDWPFVTFYFRGGAEFHLKNTGLFVFQDDIFCLAIKSSDYRHALFGAYQQVGYSFLVDVKTNTVQFVEDDCKS